MFFVCSNFNKDVRKINFFSQTSPFNVKLLAIKLAKKFLISTRRLIKNLFKIIT